ncbi:50S ribosomal protein L16 3-hydroxylase [Novosphingobium sp. BK486]|nr:50S ribosomal protein L16 3-hydroxylase [Novosphingobium sp. BK256]MBB3375755.1 50S ribosomal protein L16 3-hydroxylase [Novosphingobium sp. BK280]MBB3380168.1 50S ribosomal protein L16 3-hydroxylase [Novosphingobium sp. BK258]MBB3421862.1 50S ribosomal protein L16 3-hydroxylase [Novosphingobium sp. BK267]MBB3450518.1 50S ribosomal protein L16 3-hydroxylase [Novosphingobium sp. BK352]MBB3479029.1 50S ribosomal protein L16 3-hydroxylase [Novosphingobium sp. BK369]MBB3502343.1 50S ribosomal 
MSDAMHFAHFDIARFLATAWQKQPMLIRNPWGAWHNPLDPDELAGLACEAGVESRLIVRGAGGPVLEHGPLAEDRFASLGADPWTLLVQAVDQQVPQVADLIAPFRFVPDWRIDDVMISYATDGGGVGPHFDQYDVFLIQGLGRRRWRVGARCDAATPRQQHADLALIADFAATGDWVLEPGDILYVPPGFAHDGVALGDDCMTYSIGFRAPSRAELVEGWGAHVADQLEAAADHEADRYADPDLVLQDHPGEITPAALDRLHAMTLEALGDRVAFARWFGQMNTQAKYANTDWRPDTAADPADVAALLAQGVALRRNPAHRLAYIREGAGTLLFADGLAWPCADVALAQALCGGALVLLDPGLAGAPGTAALVTALIDQGTLAFDDGEDDEDGDWAD